jgi:hypothetical protein
MLIRAINVLWRQLAAHWTTILAAIGIGGIVAAELYPPLKAHQSVYFFLCLNAIVWTLIRIKVQLDQLSAKGELRDAVTVFPTMRAATDTVIPLLLREVEKRDTGRAIIVGGRIRSIIELLRKFGDDLALKGLKNRSGCGIQIFMMSPDFVRSMIIPGKLSPEQQKIRNENISNGMAASIHEVTRMADREVFRDNNVRISMHFYSQIPFGYYYLIGDEDLVFGGYIWDEAESDLVGPSSPCWHITAESPEFEATSKWLHSRVALYMADGKAQSVPAAA